MPNKKGCLRAALFIWQAMGNRKNPFVVSFRSPFAVSRSFLIPIAHRPSPIACFPFLSSFVFFTITERKGKHDEGIHS
jgi:hypothetical protein